MHGDGHDTLLVDLGDVDLVSVDNSVGPENGCSMKLMSAATAGVETGNADNWLHSYVQVDGDYALTAVLLPTEIRPPIL